VTAGEAKRLFQCVPTPDCEDCGSTTPFGSVFCPECLEVRSMDTAGVELTASDFELERTLGIPAPSRQGRVHRTVDEFLASTRRP
jgi:hypothetical protein